MRRYVLADGQSEYEFIYNNKKRTGKTDSFINTVICEDILMRNACSVGSHPDAYFSVFIAKRPANEPKKKNR